MINDYCNNNTCKKRYKCPIYTFLNEKISNKFFLKKYNPEDCKYKEK